MSAYGILGIVIGFAGLGIICVIGLIVWFCAEAAEDNDVRKD